MSEWKEYKLGELADVQTGPFGSQLHASDYVPVGIPTIMPTNIGNRLEIKREEISCIKDIDAKRLEKYRVLSNDIVYSRRGDVEKCAFITEKESGWLCGTGCLRLRFTALEIIPKFAAYYLSTDEIKGWISGNAVGTTMPNLNTSILKRLPILLPPFSTQQSITSILSSLDDKIGLLHRQNASLEAMAETLFRKWFVEDANDEWEVIKLGAFIATTSGYNHKQDDISDYGDFLLSMGSIIKEYGIKEEATRRVNNSEIDKRYFCGVGDIIVTTRDVTQNADLLGSPGIIPSYYKNSNVIAGSNLYKLNFTSDKVNKWTLYELLKSQLYREYVKEVASGTSILMLKKSDLDLFEFQIPQKELMTKYEKSLCEIYSKVDLNYSSIKTISSLRDTLLPKLMSGEVRVEM